MLVVVKQKQPLIYFLLKVGHLHTQCIGASLMNCTEIKSYNMCIILFQVSYYSSFKTRNRISKLVGSLTFIDPRIVFLESPPVTKPSCISSQIHRSLPSPITQVRECHVYYSIPNSTFYLPLQNSLQQNVDSTAPTTTTTTTTTTPMPRFYSPHPYY